MQNLIEKYVKYHSGFEPNTSEAPLNLPYFISEIIIIDNSLYKLADFTDLVIHGIHDHNNRFPAFCCGIVFCFMSFNTFLKRFYAWQKMFRLLRWSLEPSTVKRLEDQIVYDNLQV